jgi:hypothetical protein
MYETQMEHLIRKSKNMVHKSWKVHKKGLLSPGKWYISEKIKHEST